MSDQGVQDFPSIGTPTAGAIDGGGSGSGGGGGGGDASAANQVTTHGKLDSQTSLLTSIDGKDFATSAKQDTGNASLSSIDTKLDSQATAALQTTGNASLSSIDGKLTGISTEAKQDVGNASLSSIDGKLTGVATAALQTTGNASLSSIDGKLSTVITNQAKAPIWDGSGSFGITSKDEGGGSRSLDANIRSAAILPVEITNEQGIPSTGQFGELAVAQKEIWFNAQFQNHISRLWGGNAQGQSAAVTTANRKGKVSAGSHPGKAVIYSREHAVYSGAIAIGMEISLIFPDTGDPNCVRTWGFGQPDLSEGYFFRLNGTTLQAVRRKGGVDVDVTDADAWSENDTITPNTKGHIWSVSFQWLGVGNVTFFRDLVPVHKMELIGTLDDTSIGNPNAHVVVHVENTGTPSAETYVNIGCAVGRYEGTRVKEQTTESFYSASPAINVAGGGGYANLLAIRNRTIVRGSTNRTLVRLIDISTTSQTKDYIVRFIKNPQVTGTFVPHNRPSDPDVDWTGMTSPLTATASGNPTTGTGYADGDRVDYKVSAIGSLGETLPSSAVTVADVQTPRQSIDITWHPITHAAGYRIYRDVNNSGTFNLIAQVSDALQFTDEAIVAGSAVPAVTNDAEGDSVVEIANNVTIAGGRIVTEFQVDKGASREFALQTQLADLQPGEIMVVAADPTGTTDMSANTSWTEAQV